MYTLYIHTPHMKNKTAVLRSMLAYFSSLFSMLISLHIVLPQLI